MIVKNTVSMTLLTIVKSSAGGSRSCYTGEESGVRGRV